MEIFSEDINLTRWVIASAGLILLLGAFAMLARYLGPIGGSPLRGKNKKSRMKLKETLFLDAQTKAVIVQVDDADHTILLSPKGALHLQATEAIKEVKENTEENNNTAKQNSKSNEDDRSIGFLKTIENTKD